MPRACERARLSVTVCVLRAKTGKMVGGTPKRSSSLVLFRAGRNRVGRSLSRRRPYLQTPQLSPLASKTMASPFALTLAAALPRTLCRAAPGA